MNACAWFRRFALVPLVLLLAACTSLSVERAPAGEKAAASIMPTRQIVVVLAAQKRSQWSDIEAALGAEYRFKLINRFPLESIDVQCLIYQIPPDRSIDAVVARLRTDPRVEDVQPNRIFTSLAGPDPYADLQWGRKAIAADRSPSWATGKGVKVAIVDTGADTHHPDLRSRIAETVDLIKAQGESFDDDQHGTAVAGVIAASANNSVGIAGVAPEADLLVVKACRQVPQDRVKAMCMSWTIARAIDVAIVAQARVINLSLSGPPDPLVARLVRKAHESRIIVVASADAQERSFPAAMAEVIGVLASDSSGRVPTPAWHGESAFIAAPGVEVLTTVPGGFYDYKSGSSLSSAHVTGVIALLLNADPKCSPREIRAALFAGARVAPRGDTVRSSRIGVLDARTALRQLR